MSLVFLKYPSFSPFNPITLKFDDDDALSDDEVDFYSTSPLNILA